MQKIQGTLLKNHYERFILPKKEKRTFENLQEEPLEARADDVDSLKGDGGVRRASAEAN